MYGVGVVWPVPYGTLIIITMTVTPTTLHVFWGCMDEWNGHCYMVAVGWLTWRSSWHCHKRILLLRTRGCRKDKYFFTRFFKRCSDVRCHMFFKYFRFFLTKFSYKWTTCEYYEVTWIIFLELVTMCQRERVKLAKESSWVEKICRWLG